MTIDDIQFNNPITAGVRRRLDQASLYGFWLLPSGNEIVTIPSIADRSEHYGVNN